MTRAEFDRPHSEHGDPDAQRSLCAGMRSAPLPGMRASLEARTVFFDQQVIGAIAAGIGQVVILGAGYDDRALRFRTPGVRFFELDHPVTQADKRARLEAIGAQDAGTGGPVLAAVDLASGDVAGVLAGAGHDPSRPSLFLCEGLLVYLDQAATVRLLTGLREAGAPGSVLAVSLSTHADGLDSARVLEVANARRQAADTEPWLTILSAAAQADLLARGGWRVVTSADAADFGTGADRGRSLLVTAEPAG